MASLDPTQTSPVLGLEAAACPSPMLVDLELKTTASMGLHHTVLFAMQEAFEELRW